MAEPRAQRALLILVVCAVGAVLVGGALVLLAAGDDDAEAGPTTTTAAGEPVAVDRIEVGTCFNDASDAGTLEYTDLPVVDCDEPHDNEVYHLFDAPGGAAYPGDQEIASVTEQGCLGAFEAYVGRPYTESSLLILPIPPTEASWDAGDREVVCALYDGERAELTESMRGSGR